MRMIELTKVPRNGGHNPDPYRDSDDPTEAGSGAPAPAPAKVMIAADAIRCFYPRHAERGVGTRLTFRDGGGFAVTETYDEVVALLRTN